MKFTLNKGVNIWKPNLKNSESKRLKCAKLLVKRYACDSCCFMSLLFSFIRLFDSVVFG